MKYISVIVLLFFVNFIATPTIAVLAGVKLDIPMITISEENKVPITNAEEEEKGHFNDFHNLNQDYLFKKYEKATTNFSQLQLLYESLEFEILSPPPENLA